LITQAIIPGIIRIVSALKGRGSPEPPERHAAENAGAGNRFHEARGFHDLPHPSLAVAAAGLPLTQEERGDIHLSER
jgi:hypothetical protein